MTSTEDNAEVIRLLIAAEADPTAKNDSGRTAKWYIDRSQVNREGCCIIIRAHRAMGFLARDNCPLGANVGWHRSEPASLVWPGRVGASVDSEPESVEPPVHERAITQAGDAAAAGVDDQSDRAPRPSASNRGARALSQCRRSNANPSPINLLITRAAPSGRTITGPAWSAESPARLEDPPVDASVCFVVARRASS
jgi:hypothetical protein